VIQLNDNNLVGSVPDLSGLKKLTFLDLMNNQLSGGIPDKLMALPELQFLYLSHNKLDGTIPNLCQLSNTAKLSDIFLNDNKLSGNFPDCIPNTVSK
jgi:hypothetical protein